MWALPSIKDSKLIKTMWIHILRWKSTETWKNNNKIKLLFVIICSSLGMESGKGQEIIPWIDYISISINWDSLPKLKQGPIISHSVICLKMGKLYWKLLLEISKCILLPNLTLLKTILVKSWSSNPDSISSNNFNTLTIFKDLS